MLMIIILDWSEYCLYAYNLIWKFLHITGSWNVLYLLKIFYSLLVLYKVNKFYF